MVLLLIVLELSFLVCRARGKFGLVVSCLCSEVGDFLRCVWCLYVLYAVVDRVEVVCAKGVGVVCEGRVCLACVCCVRELCVGLLVLGQGVGAVSLAGVGDLLRSFPGG